MKSEDDPKAQDPNYSPGTSAAPLLCLNPSGGFTPCDSGTGNAPSYSENASQIAAFIVEGILFGFYACLALCALYALLGHQNRSRLRTILVSILLVLLALSATDIVLATIRIVTVLFSGPRFINVEENVFRDEGVWLNNVRGIIQACTFGIGNSVLVWKCRLLGVRRWIVFVAVVFVLGSTVAGVVPPFVTGGHTAQNIPSFFLFTACCLVTNGVLTSIIAVTMWRANHDLSLPFANLPEKIALIYLESGAILVIFLACWTAVIPNSFIATNVITAMTVPVAAITYTFITVRLGLGDKITYWLKRLTPLRRNTRLADVENRTTFTNIRSQRHVRQSSQVRKETDASEKDLFSLRRAFARLHASFGGRRPASTPSSPLSADSLEGDSRISRPWNFSHNIHVGHEALELDLASTWSTWLARHDFSQDQLREIIAVTDQQRTEPSSETLHVVNEPVPHPGTPPPRFSDVGTPRPS